MAKRSTHDFLAGGGEMGERVRAFDWSQTPAGPVANWPQSLMTAVSICLGSRHPICIWWGKQALTQFYNDGFISFLGATKHPGSLGQSAKECWSEIWDIIDQMLEGVFATGEATWSEDFLYVLNRNLPREEGYFTFSYSPIRDDTGAVGGIFCACSETTGRVIGERRLRTLRDLGQTVTVANSAEEACAIAARTLADNPHDMPFALLYLLDAEARHARLVATSGLEAGTTSAWQQIDMNEPAEQSVTWPLRRVFDTGVAELVSDPAACFGPLPGGPWPESPEAALILPITAPGQSRPTGFLVAGLSPRRIVDADYRSFFDLITGHIGTAVANARAYEEEKRRAEALAELDRAKTTFFSNVSHEFRTPLTLMLGPVEDMLANPSGEAPAETRDALTVVHRNGLRLLKLVNTLLDFSRIEAGRVQAVYDPTDLASVTTDLAGVFRSAVDRGGLRLVVDCPPLPEPVYVDHDMWEKIVLNLLSNAFKFTFEGSITVALRQAGDRAELLVRDTGTGIAAEELPHIFERFHRVQGARGRTHEGTGIGLALVHELVKLHSGEVAVASRLGEGTTFTISIPFGTMHLPADRIRAARTLASTALGATPYVEEALRWLPQEVLAEAVTPTSGVVNTPGARVLVADDNSDMREYLGRLLSQYWSVTAVADGQAALEAARAQRPDLVLADVMMPRLDGFQLLRALRAEPQTGGVPVILLSARAGEESRVEGLEAGADDYLVKPFSARELIARVQAHLELARLRQDAMSRERAARTEAEAANRAKDEFLATLSHELRTPLNSILGWAVMLRGDHVDPGSLNRGLEAIERNARAQTQLIEDVLDVSRIVTGKMRLDIRAVDLMSVIGAAIDSVRPAASAKEIRLQSILDPKAGPIAGDPDRLQQVMWNLLSNALKFTPRGGRVQVRLERVNSRVEIVVSDSGCGIDADVLAHVFDRFHQADSSPSRRHGGLGLGLALVKHLVELHGGRVRAHSDGIDQGATFIVELPLMAHTSRSSDGREHPTARRLETAIGPSALAGMRVLLVDDEADTLELFTRLFTQHGAHVTVARNAEEAIGQLGVAAPDVLVCDIEMPGEDGYSLLRKVRSQGPREGSDVPAVAVTAYGSVDDRIRLLAAGFQMHVPKPVEPAELVTVVASVAGRMLKP